MSPTTRAGESGPAYRRIAHEIERSFADGHYAPGQVLPSVVALAREFAVARGTVERALEHLESERRLVSRQGRRWVVHAETLRQDFSVVRSFGQWARAMGLVPSGRFVRRDAGRASPEEARELGIRARDGVLRVVRVRELDGRAVMVERTTYPGELAETILALPDDVPSVADVVERVHGFRLGHAEHRILAIAADPLDSRLLGVRLGAPLLRVVRTARFADGHAFEHSDDHYLADSVAFSFTASST